MFEVRFKSLLVLTIAATACSFSPLATMAQEAAKAADAVYLDEPAPAPEPAITQTGPVKEEYEPGKTRVERIVRKMSDNQIVNHGKYTEYYRSGQKFAEGAFENGVHEGSWSFWHDNGQLSKTVNFKKGMPDGTWDVFRADGTLLAKRGYKDNLRDGTWIAFSEDGKTPSLEQSFVDGKLNGKVVVYHKSGKPRIETAFKDGLREGSATEWDDTGRKVAEVNYMGGMLEGKVLRYAADGTTTEEVYKDNKRVGAPAVTGPVAKRVE